MQVDPLGGLMSAPRNAAYVYTMDRPTVATDPSGLWCLIHNSEGGCLGAGIVQRGYHVGRLVLNGPTTAAAWAWSEGTSLGRADCGWRTGLILECSGATSWANGPASFLTVGNTIINEGPLLNATVLAHETKHADQWAIFGTLHTPVGFVKDYAMASFASWVLTGHYACANIFEVWAGLESGGYGTVCSDQGK